MVITPPGPSSLLPLTVGLLALGLTWEFFRPEGGRLSSLWPAAAVATGLVYLGWRYWSSWPMTPMYLGTAALPPVLAGLALAHQPGVSPAGRFVRLAALGLAVLLGLLSWLCPKDFYLPFLKTASAFSHLYLLFTVLGKAALLWAGLWSAAGLIHQRRQDQADQRRAWRWLAGGFALWTLAMFAGEIWSYRGWGVPVVWDDAVITAFMATWFYYIGLMHLHLTGRWPVRARQWAAVAGLILILALNCTGDLGPFRPPLK